MIEKLIKPHLLIVLVMVTIKFVFIFLQSRDMNRCNDEFNSEETELILQKKLEIAIKREKAQALALSNQVFIYLLIFLKKS